MADRFPDDEKPTEADAEWWHPSASADCPGCECCEDPDCRREHKRCPLHGGFEP
jgi:hypothetical protein